MRQIALLPAGCHQSSQNILYASETKLIFSSKLALYIVNPITFIVEKIISTQTRSLQSMSVNPNNDDYIACSGVDGILCIWDIASEKCTLKFTHAADILAWDPHNPFNCAIVVNRPKIQLFSWDMRPESCSVKRLFMADSDTVVANVARWNPHIIGQIAIGGSNGVVYIYNTEQKKLNTLKVKDRATPVTDLQWDRLSAVYMLVAYQAFMALWDTEACSEVHVFDRQSTGISCIAWMDWTAGNFISANAKTGVLKVWNASQKQPLDTLRVHSTGITCMHFAAGTSRMLLGATDGTVVLYHMIKRQVEYCTSAGHTDTIFDCALAPNNPDMLGTCSYDSTVKIWNISNLSLEKTLHGPDCIIYSCTWSPDGRMIAASTITGVLVIWDAEAGRELVKYSYHKKASYGIEWNALIPDVLLSTSADASAVAIKIDLSRIGEVNQQTSGGSIGSRRRRNAPQQQAEPLSMTRYDHPAAVFGCAWCPQVDDVFATACQDGIIRIFKYGGAVAPIYLLSGHMARAFNVRWSPLIPGLLASGSDDRNIFLWEVPYLMEMNKSGEKPSSSSSTTIQPVRRLVGHTSNVRALAWNYEHRQVLLSGSWDSTIRVWNAATAVCLQIISDHVADIYTVASHPRRPFTYVSCSRDSTLRLWEVEGFAVKQRLKAIADGHLDGIIRSEEDIDGDQGVPVGTLLSAMSAVMEPTLSGSASLKLSRLFRTASNSGPSAFGERKRVANGEELAIMYRHLFDFFCGANGCLNLWDCVIAHCRSKDGSSRGGVKAPTHPAELNSAIPEDLILASVKSTARQLESVKMGVRRGDLTGKVEENLRKAAMKFAQTGDFVKYCSLMVEIGDWKAALAMAPAVSVEYWRHLMTLHAAHLETNMSEDCVPYFLGAGEDGKAVRFYMNRSEPTSAMVVAKMSEGRTDLIPNMTMVAPHNEESRPTSSRAESVGENWTGERNSAFRDKTDSEEENSRRAIRQVALHHVDTAVSQGRPITAAAHLVSIGEAEAAVALLIRSDECDMALAVAECCEIETTTAARLMAEKAESLQDLELGVELLQRLSGGDVERECALMLTRHSTFNHFDARHLSMSDKHKDHLHRAAEARDIGRDEDSIQHFILGMDMAAAAGVVVDRLSRHLRDPFNVPPAASAILLQAKNIRSIHIQDPMKSLFLCCMNWFGAHKAIRMGFWDIAPGMIRCARTLAKKCDFAISHEQLAFHELCVRIQYRDPHCLEAIDSLSGLDQSRQTADSASSSLSTEVVNALRSVKSLIRDAMADGNVQRLDAARTPYKIHAQPLYGILTGLIEEEVRRIGSLLSLPSLPSTLPDPPVGIASVFKIPFGNSCVDVMNRQPVVVQGSVLPVANQTLKTLNSCVTGNRIQGCVVLLGDQLSFMSKNEAIMWRMVNPFSPVGDGEFIEI